MGEDPAVPTQGPEGWEEPMPRWVKLFALGAVLLLLVVLVGMVVLGGDHGPTRHLPAAPWSLGWT